MDCKVIINLLVMVEMVILNIYVDLIEWMSCYFVYCENVILLLYFYNDCGIVIVVVELGYMVGVDCIEGCLFGNGECMGNVDFVVLGINMFM